MDATMKMNHASQDGILPTRSRARGPARVQQSGDAGCDVVPNAAPPSGKWGLLNTRANDAQARSAARCCVGLVIPPSPPGTDELHSNGNSRFAVAHGDGESGGAVAHPASET